MIKVESDSTDVSECRSQRVSQPVNLVASRLLHFVVLGRHGHHVVVDRLPFFRWVHVNQLLTGAGEVVDEWTTVFYDTQRRLNTSHRTTHTHAHTTYHRTTNQSTCSRCQSQSLWLSLLNFHRARNYDTIRYLCTLINWRDGQLNLAHGTETNEGKTENKNRVA